MEAGQYAPSRNAVFWVLMPNTGFQLPVFQRVTKGHEIADDRLGRRAPDLLTILDQNGPKDPGYENDDIAHGLLLGHRRRLTWSCRSPGFRVRGSPFSSPLLVRCRIGNRHR